MTRITPAAERQRVAWDALTRAIAEHTTSVGAAVTIVNAVAVYARACEDVARGEEVRRLLRNHRTPAPEAPTP